MGMRDEFVAKYDQILEKVELLRVENKSNAQQVNPPGDIYDRLAQIQRQLEELDNKATSHSTNLTSTANTVGAVLSGVNDVKHSAAKEVTVLTVKEGVLTNHLKLGGIEMGCTAIETTIRKMDNTLSTTADNPLIHEMKLMNNNMTKFMTTG